MNYEIAYLIAALVVLVIHIILAYQASIIADAKGHSERYNVGNSLLPDWFLRLHIGCSTSRQKADEKRRENC